MMFLTTKGPTMKFILASTALLLVLCFNVPVKAQWTVAPQIVVSIPQSDFENVSKTGGGFGVKVARKLSILGGIELRGDFAFLSYGKEFNQLTDRAGTPIVDFFGFPIIAEFRNEGLRMTFGPQYTLGTDTFKLYGTVMGGWYYFRTNVTTQSSTVAFSDSRDNNFALGWNFGGGLLYDIGLGPWIDVSLQYQTIFNLPASSEVQDEQLGDITAHEFTLKFGVLFFLK